MIGLGRNFDLNVVTPIMIRTVVAFGVALGGGLLSALLARTHKQLCALISLGAGTLLGVTVFAIGPECWRGLAAWQFLLAAASGYALFAIISKYIFHVCPACAASHFDEAATHRFGEIAAGHDDRAGHSLHGRWPGAGGRVTRNIPGPVSEPLARYVSDDGDLRA
jgi:hypothetical protein